MVTPRVVVTSVDGLDAIAWRTGDDVLIHICVTVPVPSRTAVTEYLHGAVLIKPGETAVVRLPLYASNALASYQPPVPRPRSPWVRSAAVVVGVVLPSAALLTSDEPQVLLTECDDPILDQVPDSEPQPWLDPVGLDYSWFDLPMTVDEVA